MGVMLLLGQQMISQRPTDVTAVLESDSLVEYALRQTLVADAVSLQFRLPPPGVPAPTPRKSNAIAHGAPVVDTLVITSVWAVHLLRTLSQVAVFAGPQSSNGSPLAIRS